LGLHLSPIPTSDLDRQRSGHVIGRVGTLYDFEQLLQWEKQVSWAKDELSAKPEVTPAFRAELRRRPEIIKDYPDLAMLVDYMKWVRAYKSYANYEVNGHLQSRVMIGNYSFAHILEPN